MNNDDGTPILAAGGQDGTALVQIKTAIQLLELQPVDIEDVQDPGGGGGGEEEEEERVQPRNK